MIDTLLQYSLLDCGANGLPKLLLLHVNAVFACDLLTAEHDELLLEGLITLGMYDISFTCDGASAMTNYL